MFNVLSFIILFCELRLAMGSGCNAKDVQATWVALARVFGAGSLPSTLRRWWSVCFSPSPAKRASASLSPSTEVRVSGKKTFPALKSFVCYKSWRAVLEAPDGHETNLWQPEKFMWWIWNLCTSTTQPHRSIRI